ncbi:MAG: hypothetical protein WKG00_27930 [Polyangiaceae bacterium]
MEIVLAVISILLAVAGLVSAVVVRVAATVANHRLATRGEDGHVSSTPLVGSILGFVAILLAPVGTISQRIRWAWVPLALEVTVALGCGLAFWLAGRLSSR